MAHPVLALWAHPRSMSTATERIMRERGDLDCAHEPFMYDYYVGRRAGVTPHFDVDPEHPKHYEDIREMIETRAEAAPVFFKDMSYYVMPRLLGDEGFRDRLRHAFLVRMPEAAIASYYRLDKNFTSEEIGIEAQWRHYEGLRDAGHDPVVLRAEDIRNDPRAEMTRLWEGYGLGDAPQAFDWSEETPDDWEAIEKWHGTASATSGIRPMEEGYAERAREKFEAAAQEAPHLRDYLAHHRPFYERLAEVAERQKG
ncbi:hypothetical protein K1T73_15030 [Roseovarius sp. SCSIO 43702]|uniref:sulfotransferase-like domain-containing protein n=1 Tax=Roseovarius sp. SCSIO 43702 TaxID=2823043 RepID=UPI001C72E0C1|nr:hypothetical protein [Roseovarius sp. SCSIO 43702]QYX56351.1 hypothetical protein K1T73_15030 [Roseovarius sp. SCSIO 43702]